MSEKTNNLVDLSEFFFEKVLIIDKSKVSFIEISNNGHLINMVVDGVSIKLMPESRKHAMKLIATIMA